MDQGSNQVKIQTVSRGASNEEQTQTVSRGASNAEQKKRGPVIQPTEFSGAGDWTTWLRKFQRLAELYSWETSEKLIWLEAKLSGQAARAFEVIDEDTKKDFDGVAEILTRRFEPESRQLLYQEKLFAYQRKRGEDWATVAENIKELAARAHPSSDGLAEGFALSRFLTLLEEDADLAVGVRRSAPKTLDEAVREATRLDSINQTVKKPKAVNPVEAAGTMAVSMQQVLNGISELKVSQEDNFSSIKGKLDNHEERLRCLEKATNSQADNGKRERGQRVSCFKCGRPGHIAKYCRGVKGVKNNYNYMCITMKRRSLGRIQHLEFSLSPQ